MSYNLVADTVGLSSFV